MVKQQLLGEQQKSHGGLCLLYAASSANLDSRLQQMRFSCVIPNQLTELSEQLPPTCTEAFMKRMHNRQQNWRRYPNFSNTCHKASCGTESYAFLRSTKRTKRRLSFSLAFSESCNTEVSAMHCSYSCTILSSNLPATSNRPIPFQLSHSCKSPFFGTGTTMYLSKQQTLPPSPTPSKTAQAKLDGVQGHQTLASLE